MEYIIITCIREWRHLCSFFYRWQLCNQGMDRGTSNTLKVYVWLPLMREEKSEVTVAYSVGKAFSLRLAPIYILVLSGGKISFECIVGCLIARENVLTNCILISYACSIKEYSSSKMTHCNWFSNLQNFRLPLVLFVRWIERYARLWGHLHFIITYMRK